MRTRGFAVLVVNTMCLMGLSAPTWAEKGDQQIRFGLLYSAPTSDQKIGDVTYELKEGEGFFVSYEYMLTGEIGIEGAVGSVKHDAERQLPGVFDEEFGDVDLLTLSASGNFYLLQRDRWDLYLGPTIGYAFWGKLKDDVFNNDLSTGDEFYYEFDIGTDVMFGEGKWGFTAKLGYLWLDLPVDDLTQDIGVDPFQVKVGAAYRF